MTALVTKHLPLVAEAPDGMERLRGLILELAVRGKLTAQSEFDGCGSDFLAQVRCTRKQLLLAKEIKAKELQRSEAITKPPFAIPSNWTWAELDELAPYSLTDGDWIESKDQDPAGEIRLLQLADVGVGVFKNKSAKFINSETFSRLGCTELRPGDILIARLPNPIGRACVFPQLSQPCITVVDVAILRPYADGCTGYVVLAINSGMFRNQVESYGKGATRFRIATGHLKQLRLPLPPVTEQHRIVAKVDELMTLCDRLEADQADAEAAHAQLVQALLDSLTQATDAADFRASWQRLSEHFNTLFTTEASIDALKQTVLQLAVMGKLVPQSSLDEPASDLLVRAKAATVKAAKAGSGATPLPVDLPFELPGGWAWARFNDLIAPGFPIAYGVLVPGPDSADGVPFVRIADLDLVAPKPLPEKRISPEVDAQFARTKLRGGEILMGVVGSIGKLGLAPASWAGANIARAVCRIVPTSAVSTPYVLWLLQTQFMRQQFLGDTRTLAQPTLNVGLIRDALTPVPPLAEQHRIVAKVDELMTLCDQLKAQLAEARQQHAQLATVLVEQAVAVH